MRVEITPAAATALDKTVDQFGSTKLNVMSRMVKWLAAQDTETQAMVLGLHPAAEQNDAAMRYLKKLSTVPTPGVNKLR